MRSEVVTPGGIISHLHPSNRFPLEGRFLMGHSHICTDAYLTNGASEVQEVALSAQNHVGTDSCYSNPKYPRQKCFPPQQKAGKKGQWKGIVPPEVLSLFSALLCVFISSWFYLYCSSHLIFNRIKTQVVEAGTAVAFGETRWLKMGEPSVPKNHLPKLEFRLALYLKGREYGWLFQTSCIRILCSWTVHVG